MADADELVRDLLKRHPHIRLGILLMPNYRMIVKKRVEAFAHG